MVPGSKVSDVVQDLGLLNGSGLRGVFPEKTGKTNRKSNKT